MNKPVLPVGKMDAAEMACFQTSVLRLQSAFSLSELSLLHPTGDKVRVIDYTGLL